jgi:hypothetical protein
MIDLDRIMPELIRHHLLPATYQCVFVAGSLIRGWGNETSDVDIYIVTDSPWQSGSADPRPVQLRHGLVPVEIHHMDGRRWDVEYWQTAQVDELLAKVSWEEVNRGGTSARQMSWLENDFLERVSYGAALDGADYLGELARRRDASAFRSLMVARSLDYLDLSTEDATGQLDNGDVESAVIAAKLAFGNAVDALLASHGEFGHNEKWRARRMRAVTPKELSFEDYWSVETMRDFDPATPRSWVEQVLARCNRIATEVVV